MSLRYAILTALTERESSGAQLTRRFDRSFGFFWSATHQQIYRELDRLRREKMIVERTAPNAAVERGQPRLFAITKRGRDDLRRWISEPSEPSALRDSIMVRVRAAAATGETVALEASLHHHLAVHTETLDMYREIEARDFVEPGDPGDELRYLVLRGGLALEAARADWCRDALEVLRRINAESAPS